MLDKINKFLGFQDGLGWKGRGDGSNRMGVLRAAVGWRRGGQRGRKEDDRIGVGVREDVEGSVLWNKGRELPRG